MERHMLCLILLLFTTYYFLLQKKNMNVGEGWVGCAGWAIAHPCFSTLADQLVKSILISGGKFCPPHYYLPTQL